MHNGRTAFIIILSIALALVIGCSKEPVAKEVIVESYTDYKPNPDDLALIRTMRANRDAAQSLQEIYQELPLIDIHNHDVENPIAVQTWGQYGIDRIVLFGSISEPHAQVTDKEAWVQYQAEPDHVYPSFAGFPVYEEEGVTYVKERLEQGYLNIGEIAAASTFSPVVSALEWKAEHPNDGYLPEIYELAAEYRTPILLHIDPPNGMPILYLEEALEQHRGTSMIFGHANAYNPPSNIEALLAKHPNLYIDFFAGFTAYSRDSTNTLQDFVPVIEQYPDRFMLSTDSGYGLSRYEAAQGLYEIIDLLTPETAVKVAYQNYERLLEQQPPTASQIEQIKALAAESDRFETYRLNKRMANELIMELTGAITNKVSQAISTSKDENQNSSNIIIKLGENNIQNENINWWNYG